MEDQAVLTLGMKSKDDRGTTQMGSEYNIANLMVTKDSNNFAVLHQLPPPVTKRGGSTFENREMHQGSSGRFGSSLRRGVLVPDNTSHN